MTRSRRALSLAPLGACLVAGAAASARQEAPPAAPPPPVALELVPEKATPRLGGYLPLRVTLSAEKPPSLKKAPADLGKGAQFGTITLGPKDKAATLLVALDAPEGGTARLFIDANANGDLTDDPAPEWKPAARPYKGRDGKDYTMYQGAAKLPLEFGGKATPVAVGLYKFDPTDPARAALKDVLFYYRDWGFQGTATLGDKTYPMMLDDQGGTGDLTNTGRVALLIDVNGNGRFDARGERFSAGRPFNIGGVTYEVKGVDVAKGTLTLAKSKSDRAVAEIPVSPDLGPGKPAVAFTAKTTDGGTVDFPKAYKGKIVLLDFWATWCGPCIAELPNVVKAYEAYHDKGFDILGISLDRADAAEKLAAFTKEHRMPWPQVYDGKFWQAEVAQTYAVDAIPAAFLIDGDTGAVLASGNSLRGEGLAKAVEAALAAKK